MLPLLGWGGWGRGLPEEAYTGETRDSLWLITFNKNGFVGLFSLYIGMLVGPWLVLRASRKKSKSTLLSTQIPILLGLVLIFFMIDSLFNGMINPIYILNSGGLVRCYLNHRHEIMD
jgi:O-antigen ligase